MLANNTVTGQIEKGSKQAITKTENNKCKCKVCKQKIG